jgi:hypothetical protein
MKIRQCLRGVSRAYLTAIEPGILKGPKQSIGIDLLLGGGTMPSVDMPERAIAEVEAAGHVVRQRERLRSARARRLSGGAAMGVIEHVCERRALLMVQ